MADEQEGTQEFEALGSFEEWRDEESAAREALAEWLPLPTIKRKVRVASVPPTQLIDVVSAARIAGIEKARTTGWRSKAEMASWLVHGVLQPKLTPEQAHELLDKGTPGILECVKRIVALSGFPASFGFGQEALALPYMQSDVMNALFGPEAQAAYAADQERLEAEAEDAQNPTSDGSSSPAPDSAGPSPVSDSSTDTPASLPAEP